MESINNIKKSILKKKILLGFVIDHYSFWDKFFRYTHLTFAFLAPIVTLIDTLFNDKLEITSIPTLALGTIVAAMLKLKDYLKFDKIREEAKAQTIRYEYLYQKIDREMSKSIERRYHHDDFLYWINREFNNITLSDPDISLSIKDKYVKMCKAKNIPYDEDMDMLMELIVPKKDGISIEIKDGINIQNKVEIKEENKINDKQSIVNDNQPTIKEANRRDSIVTYIDDVKSNTKATIPYLPDNSELTITKETLQDKVKTFDTKADMTWVMDRLNEL
jgi:hypothetical protein